MPDIDPTTGLPTGELLPIDPNDPPAYVDTTDLGQDVPVYTDDPRLTYTAGDEFSSLKGSRIKDDRIRDSGMVPLGESGKTWKDEMADDNSELRRTLRANGFFMPKDMKMNEAFYRYPRADPYNYVDGAKEYLFFTKPDLPLLKDPTSLIQPADKIPYFADLIQSEGYRKSVFYNLCASAAAEAGDIHKCPFIRILSNRKTSNMDIPDIQVDELESAVNMYGTKILYPKSSQASDEGVDFSIEFEDTRFCEIYHLWKVYDIYRQLKWKGVLGPTVNLGRYDLVSSEGISGALKDRWKNMERIFKRAFGLSYDVPGTSGDGEGYSKYNKYTYYKILYDHFSVFKFLVGSDGETILFMAKATGVYARSISRSSFSEIPDRGPLKITVGFKVSGWFEDSTPEIVSDFNELVKAWLGKEPLDTLKEREAPIYDYDIDYVSQELVKCPVIYQVEEDKKGGEYSDLSRLGEFKTYKLGWIKMDDK